MWSPMLVTQSEEFGILSLARWRFLGAVYPALKSGRTISFGFFQASISEQGMGETDRQSLPCPHRPYRLVKAEPNRIGSPFLKALLLPIKKKQISEMTCWPVFWYQDRLRPRSLQATLRVIRTSSPPFCSSVGHLASYPLTSQEAFTELTVIITWARKLFS